MNKKQVFLWTFYDFANSVASINFLLYFSQWLVIDGGLSDFWYNATFAISTILLILTAPTLAALTDKHGGRKYFLNISTIGNFLSYGLAAIFAYIAPSHIFLITTLFLFGQYFYQLSFVFYNPMLSEIADKKHRGFVSGLGQFSNAIGQVVGLLLTLPLAGVRLAPLLPALGIFLILALPMMIYFKETKTRQKSFTVEEIKSETKVYTKKFIAFFSASIATPMLVAFFFFNDALITLSNNYPIFMDRVFAVPDSTKSFLLMGILISSGLGGLFAGWLGDKIGNLNVLKYILIGWIILLPIISFTSDFKIFIVLTILVGLLLGSVFTVARSYLTELLPEESMGYGFSFYTLAERFATFLGPLTWGGIILFLGTGGQSYRIAMASMTIFIIIGLVILQRKWVRRTTI
jgi:UMF1 family MFS transporter